MSALPAHLLSLLTPPAYAHPVKLVRLIETHISWVLITGEFAYKLKRPVQYPFVDLRSAERRAFCCAEEIRLNRRFAPELYLGVSKITAKDGQARMDGEGPAVEHAVRMRQFECEEGLDRLLATRRVEPGELEVFGRNLAAIHAQLPVAQDPQAWGRPDSVVTLLLENLAQCVQLAAPHGTQSRIRAICEPYEARVRAAKSWIGIRRNEGRVRECHGDLHARNVVRYAGRLVAFDCIEFEPAFRWIDVAEEIAFLLMDLEARHAPLHAQAFMGGYLAHSGDYQACRLLRLYEIHHALVRAKVAAVEASNASEASARDGAIGQHEVYLECARRFLARESPMLLLMFGSSGSGKTWLAKRLAPLLDAVHLRSDIERKRMAGLAEHERSDSAVEQGLYSQQSSARVYEHLARCADDALAGGYSVIVDATFSRRGDRERFRKLAVERGVELRVIRCHAPKEVLAARIAERQRAQADASEADLAVLAWQQSHREPVTADEGLTAIDADTTLATVVEEVCENVRQVRSAPMKSRETSLE
jgi:aminoglycoside phosphotransferase family enzyme/predicted kinase